MMRLHDSNRVAVRREAGWTLGVCFMATLIVHPAFSADAVSAHNGKRSTFRIGFSAEIFADVNRSDALASVKVWADTLVEDRGLRVDPEAVILSSVYEVREALERESVEAVALPVDDFFDLDGPSWASKIVFSVIDGGTTEQYVLLVQRDSGMNRLDDLRGKELTAFDNARTSLADEWLELELGAAGLPPTEKHFGTVRYESKLSQCILKAFFDAGGICLSTRRGWDAMAELNPQVGVQLRPIAASPEVIPAIMAVRDSYDSPETEGILRAIDAVHETMAGRQVLTIFKVDRLFIDSVDALQSTQDLVERYERSRGGSQRGLKDGHASGGEMRVSVGLPATGGSR
jgi:ABC-type phosphate/phosphonate transport system substrate-binding protein